MKALIIGMATALASVHTVFSTQNAAQQRLARRFELLTGLEKRTPIRSKRLQGLQRDRGDEESWRTDK